MSHSNLPVLYCRIQRFFIIDFFWMGNCQKRRHRQDEHEDDPLPPNIDFSAFDETAFHDVDSCCDIHDCLRLCRLINALKYYEYLCAKTSQEREERLMAFIDRKYPDYLNDTVHLVTSHGEDLEQIYDLLFDQYGFKKCELTECVYSDRHCRIGSSSHDESEQKLDPLLAFYQDTFDSVHHFLLHLFDLGLRSRRSFASDAGQPCDEQDEASCVDPHKRQELAAFFDRFSTQNNKFVMQSNVDDQLAQTQS